MNYISNLGFDLSVAEKRKKNLFELYIIDDVSKYWQ